MAHSYLSVRNSRTERTICVTDSILRIFMYFFIEVTAKSQLDDRKREINIHYDWELANVNTSFIDLKLEEINTNDELNAWYILELSKLELLLDSYIDEIDNNYLNRIKELKSKQSEYTHPIKVCRLKNLINDICWLLNKNNVTPSGDFKWFENS